MNMPSAERIFLVALFIAAGYITLMYVLALRLGWLRRSGRVPSAPYTIDFLFKRLGLNAIWFLFSERHKQIHDVLSTVLVIVCRALLLTYLPLFAFLIWRFYVPALW